MAIQKKRPLSLVVRHALPKTVKSPNYLELENSLMFNCQMRIAIYPVGNYFAAYIHTDSSNVRKIIGDTTITGATDHKCYLLALVQGSKALDLKNYI